MGLAVAALVNMDGVQLFEEHEVQRLVELLRSADCVAGWNLDSFDLQVIGGKAGRPATGIRTFDLMTQFETLTGRRLDLENVSVATLGTALSPNGLALTAAWKKGDRKVVAEGCAKGADTIKSLLEYASREGALYFVPSPGEERRRVEVSW